ncbi:hypothetical protein BN946_scf184867.g2 [Trametes cinnabarina]|uniref:Uncharacterized protein n=1 Tax=Pycnoporus cinnabarinus TaxID=5643 RepID=A0A060SQB6_PYCCI|nr:hypothetical protein BN946_scf184867.g2 [Trametes cinnabarina]
MMDGLCQKLHQQRYRVTVEEEAEPDSIEGEDSDDWDLDWDNAELEEESNEDKEVYGLDMGACDRLHGQFMREVAELENQLSEEDKAILHTLAFLVKHNLSEDAFAELPQVFPTARLPSLHKIKARITFLSGI